MQDIPNTENALVNRCFILILYWFVLFWAEKARTLTPHLDFEGHLKAERLNLVINFWQPSLTFRVLQMPDSERMMKPLIVTRWYPPVIIPMNYRYNPLINPSEIGLICTNLANYGAPPCRRFPKDLGALWTSHGLCWDESMNKPGAMKPGNGKSPVCRWPISSCKGKIL